ncbi:hypothetical protein LKK83_01570 [Phormidium sp. CCY1219]|nr:hypothetical protein [Phormidium sp. CCY1219]
MIAIAAIAGSPTGSKATVTLVTGPSALMSSKHDSQLTGTRDRAHSFPVTNIIFSHDVNHWLFNKNR